jgi:hypothetical protein
MALPSCVDKVTLAKIPMVTGGYNGGYMSSTELLMQWDLAMQVLFNAQKLQKKFQQEKTSRCQIVRIKQDRKKKIKSGYPIFKLRSFGGAYLDPIQNRFQEMFKFLKYLNKHGRYSLLTTFFHNLT